MMGQGRLVGPLLGMVMTMMAARSCLGCTVFIVGKDASVDGSVMVSHSNDGEFDTDPRLVKIPSGGAPPGAERPVYFSPEDYPRYVGTARGAPEYYPKGDEEPFVPIGSIPEAAHTFAYLEDTYGAVNEQQVGIGESTCSGIFGSRPLGMPNGTALFSIDVLSQIAMERATSARSAVEMMGQLAELYGFYGAGEFEGTSESLGVIDTQEAWIFQILPDPTGTTAIWVAQRVADDGFAVLANMFVVRQVDPDDPENFLMSSSVHDVAKEYGWWKEEDGLLDFTKIYSDGEYAHKYYSGRRMWGGYHLACPSLNLPAEYVDLQSDPVYPVYCKPDYLLSQQDLFRFHRYTYKDTPYSLTADGNLAGGPFSTPDRWKPGKGEQIVHGNWERAIGLYRTSDSYVVQSSESFSKGAVMWFGPASALATVFTPFLVSSEIPASFRSGHQGDFSRESAFWAACFAHNVANLKWSYAIQDVTKRQDLLEQQSIELINSLQGPDGEAFTADETEMLLLDNAAGIVASLWSLSDEIVFKYASGFVNEPGDLSQMVGYPAWWLKAVGYEDGPPPPPTKPRCCHPTLDEQEPSQPPPLTGKAAMKEFLRMQKQQQE